RVMQPVYDLLAATLADHEAEVPQLAQLVRDGRRLHADRGRELTDRACALLEPPEDQDAARRREHLHALGDGARGRRVDVGWLRPMWGRGRGSPRSGLWSR